MIDFEFSPSEFFLHASESFPHAEEPFSHSGDSRPAGAYLNSLNDRQKEAVLITDGPLIVLAGAGSGKTKMLTSRICHIIETGKAFPSQVLAVTFTNKAAGEMRERVEKMLNVSSGKPEIGTFHSVCVRILRREMEKLPFTQPFVIYDDSDQLSLIKQIMEKLTIDDKAFSPKGIQAAINAAKCDALEPHELEISATYDFHKKKVKLVYEQYQKDLITNNALDFGEILCMTYRLLRDRPEIRAKYQHRFRYIHVDEYQDTNRAQYLLLSILAQARFGGHQNICVVGDEDQSIYKWRGADIRNILDFEKDYPGAQVVKLEQNYRSTKTIITAAGHVIRNNSARKDKTLWTENEDGLPLIRVQLSDEREEAELTVSEIKRLAANEARVFGDFAIFYRTNAQSRQFEDFLRREKIPYQIVGGLRFYDRKEIKDVLSYMKVILNPSDSVNLKRIINVPARGIGKTTLDKLDAFLASQPEGTSAWDVLKHAASDPSLTSAGTAKKLAQFVSFIDELRAAAPKSLLTDLYHRILDGTGYVQSLRKEGTEEALARIDNLEEFDNLLQEFEADQQNALSPDDPETEKPGLLPLFIEQSTLASDVDQLNEQASSVKLMTLHSSKGLEFPVVFMSGMEEGLFPSYKVWEEVLEEDIEEERRLCYVGMTRARELLYMMSVAVRHSWGNVNIQEPSRFFDEIPSEFVEFKDLVASRRQSYSSPTKQADFSANHSGGGSAKQLINKKIQHPEYGLGTILAAEGSGEGQKVVVEFSGKQQKKFLFKYVAGYVER